MVKAKRSDLVLGGTGEPIFTPRFIAAITLAVVGIAWVLYYYFGVHPSRGLVVNPPYRGIQPLKWLKDWNYLIGFGLFFLGLIVSADRSTPLGRNRGVVISMLSCFIGALLWICVFYIFNGTHLEKIWVFNDLGQKNLFVGFGFLICGFFFATRWE
jgi:drug/metabolite transporter (DMT)-like permease